MQYYIEWSILKIDDIMYKKCRNDQIEWLKIV